MIRPPGLTPIPRDLFQLTAGEWRARGLEVDPEVPDCAALEWDGEAWATGGDWVWLPAPRWRWVTFSGSFTAPGSSP